MKGLLEIDQKVQGYFQEESFWAIANWNFSLEETSPFRFPNYFKFLRYCLILSDEIWLLIKVLLIHPF